MGCHCYRTKSKEGNYDSPHLDHRNDMKKTMVSKREKEMIAISEFILKLKVGTEVPLRKYICSNVLEILSTFEPELVNKADEEKWREKKRNP